MVRGSYILKFEGHYFVAVCLLVSDEGCVLSIFESHTYMIIPEKASIKVNNL